MAKRYSIITYGCQMNVHESEKLAGVLENSGYLPCDNAQSADIYVLNTCCIRENAETHALGNLGQIKKIKERNPATKVVVCGCMTQAEGAAEKLIQRCPFIDLVFGTHNLHEFSRYLLELEEDSLHKKTKVEIWPKEGPIAEDMPVSRSSGLNAWVNIMFGCNNFCTYCIVPYVRGRERSRDKNNIYRDVEALVREGYKEITLLGQNVNSYGNDLPHEDTTFANLLRELSQIKGNYRLKFMTSHPKDLSEDVVRAMAESCVCSHFVHIPAQAGSNAILQQMNRKYTFDQYMQKIACIRKYMPDAGISGDIMVGFPGETEADFAETLRLVREVRYDNLFTFIYSPRKGTPAAAMPQIEESIKKERIQRVIDTQFAIACEKAKEEIGREYTVLCFSYADGMAIGKTDSEKTVYFKAKQNPIGKFIPVKITDCKNTKVYGEAKE